MLSLVWLGLLHVVVSRAGWSSVLFVLLLLPLMLFRVERLLLLLFLLLLLLLLRSPAPGTVFMLAIGVYRIDVDTLHRRRR